MGLGRPPCLPTGGGGGFCIGGGQTWDTTAYSQQEGGTHPTVMLSCFSLKFNNTIVFISDVSYRASKRQPHQGFHAVRGKRLNLPNFPSIKRPSSLDFPVSRRDPPIRGFSAVRGKK